MRILILTQPLGHNFGGLLQAYALQKFLISAGHEVVTLDRRFAGNLSEKIEEFISAKRYRKGKIKRIKNLLTKLKSKIKRNSTKKIPIDIQNESYFKNLILFRDKHITLSQRVNTSRQLYSYFVKEKFDAVIVGSDQVWRPKYSPRLSNFFLDFLSNYNEPMKRISYAASFGVDDWEYTPEETKECKALIGKFDAVTVREKSAISLCKKYFDVAAEVVTDPTLLLKQEDYIQFFSDSDRNKDFQDMVTAYILDSDDDKREIAINVARRLGKRVVLIEPHKTDSKSEDGQIIHLSLPKISEWLRALASASFIVTDSFHGCVFSIIFNKPFIAVGNHDRGLCRFQSLLDIFKLDDRLIVSKSDIDYDMLTREPDWKSVNKCKNDWVAASQDFLKLNLK